MSGSERYQVEITGSEVGALVKYHCSVTRRITKQAGEEILKTHSGFFPKSRQMKIIHDEAKSLVDFHLARAKALQGLLKNGR